MSEINIDNLHQVEIITSPGKKCLFLHKWKKVKDTGFTSYFECQKCGSRKVHQKSNGYQPIDWNWLSF